MKNIYRFGGIASFVNAGAGFATLLVVFILIGPEALSNPDKLAEMAVENPTPLIILDILKILTCITLLCIIYILHKVFKDRAPYKIKIGTFFGLISAIFLLANAGLSLFTVIQTGQDDFAASGNAIRVNEIINFLGLTVIFFNGVWYLVINWLALNHQEFPKRLAYLGIALGVVSLIPILGALVLLLSIPWYLGLRRVMINWNNADSVHTPN